MHASATIRDQVSRYSNDVTIERASKEYTRFYVENLIAQGRKNHDLSHRVSQLTFTKMQRAKSLITDSCNLDAKLLTPFNVMTLLHK